MVIGTMYLMVKNIQRKLMVLMSKIRQHWKFLLNPRYESKLQAVLSCHGLNEPSSRASHPYKAKAWVKEYLPSLGETFFFFLLPSEEFRSLGSLKVRSHGVERHGSHGRNFVENVRIGKPPKTASETHNCGGKRRRK